MKAKAATHLRGIKLDELISFAKKIQTGLQAPMFAGITPTPAQVLSKLTQLEIYYNESQRKNYSHIAQRDDLAHEIKSMLSTQCMAVNGLAHGDLDVIVKSKFNLVKGASNPGIAEPPVNVRVGRGMEAWHVKVRFGSVPSRQYYTVHVTDAAGEQHYYTCRNTTLVITDLAPNQEVQIRVRAINSRGEGEYTCSTLYYISPGVRNNATPQLAK